VDEHGRVMPPAPRIGGHLGRRRSRHAEFTQLGVNPGAAFSLLEMERSQTVANPLVVRNEHSGRIRQLEVSLPSSQMVP